MVFLTTVENSFEIPGRVCWLTPRRWASDLRICEQESIQPRSPDGKILSTRIGWIERAYGTSMGVRLTIGLPPGIRKEDVPEGTEIWLVEPEAT